MEITVREANSDELVRALRAGELDMAFVGLAGDTPEGLALYAVADEAVVAAVAADGGMAEAGAVVAADGGMAEAGAMSLESLAGLPLISLPPGTGLRTCLDRACAARGIQVRVAFEASDLEMVAGLAGRGLGVALLPESVARAHGETLRAVALSGAPMRCRIGLAWRAGGPSNPAARALISQAREAMGPAGGG